MFGKVIVFGLFEMIKKKKCGPRPWVRVRPPGLVGLGMTGRAVTFLVVSEPRFRRFYKINFEIFYDMH